MRFLTTVLATLIFTGPALAQFTLQDDAQRGRLHVKEGNKNVLCYNYGMQLNTGAEEKYERGCYVHPLWDVNGWQRTITEDFAPLDGHLHHRGLGWTWPDVKVRGKQVQTWHPSDPPLRQHFVKWIKKEATDDKAVIGAEVAWMLDDKEKVLTEMVQITMGPMKKVGTMPHNNTQRPPVEVNARAVDFKITLEAVGGPLTLEGAKGKGYGGFMIRGSYDMNQGSITTNEGPLPGDSVRKGFQWADLSFGGRGVAIFTPPDHPPHLPDPKNKGEQKLTPPQWLLRTSFAGLLNVAWPGVVPYTLEPGKPVTLEYRVYVHMGDAEQGKVADAYKQYIDEKNKTNKKNK